MGFQVILQCMYALKFVYVKEDASALVCRGQRSNSVVIPLELFTLLYS